MSGWRSLFWVDPTLCLVLIFFFINGLVVENGSFSLIHSSHCFTCEIGSRLIVVQRINCCNLVWARPYVNIRSYLIDFLWFWLRPRNSPSLDDNIIWIVLPWAYFIFFFSFKILNRWLIKFKLVVFILIITISMYIRWNWRNRLILIDIDKMLKNFRFCCCICAQHFWSHFETLMTAA